VREDRVREEEEVGGGRRRGKKTEEKLAVGYVVQRQASKRQDKRGRGVYQRGGRGERGERGRVCSPGKKR